MRGKSIVLLQEVLRRIGYSIHDQKGLFGTDTRDAVKSFQKQQGLKPTGQVDEALMQLMQHGHSVVIPEEVDSSPDEITTEGSITQKQWDALVGLLIKKGVIEEGELKAEMNKVIPQSL